MHANQRVHVDKKRYLHCKWHWFNHRVGYNTPPPLLFFRIQVQRYVYLHSLVGVLWPLSRDRGEEQSVRGEKHHMCPQYITRHMRPGDKQRESEGCYITELKCSITQMQYQMVLCRLKGTGYISGIQRSILMLRNHDIILTEIWNSCTCEKNAYPSNWI